jgi:hypothetical protein
MLYQLSYAPVARKHSGLRGRLPTLLVFSWRGYLVSRWRVWARHRGQNLLNSIRSGSLRLFLTVV